MRNLKVGDIVWIKEGEACCRGSNYPSPMQVIVTNIDLPDKSFSGLPKDPSLRQVTFYYKYSEIFEPKSTRKCKFIGGHQVWQI